MNMNLSLTDELTDFVKAKVMSGHYSSSQDVVIEALRLLEKRDQTESEKLQWLQNAWAGGIESGDAGELNFAELKKEARECLMKNL
jgi:antitoxin ParD1/3/4